MAQPTKPYKNTFSGSVGAGVGSLFNPNKRRYYILEHKVSSKYHKAGSTQEIIVDQIEIGRDSRCQVRFDESFRTVSRHHAAIVKDGDNWKLVQISQNNSTLLNGHPVKTEWYLQNGDEIQLSINGPKLGFIIPTGNKATVGSIGMTKRLSLFRQQALRPYKRAIVALASLLVLITAGLGAWNIMLQNDLKAQSKSLADQIILAKGNKAKTDSLNNELIKANKKISDQDRLIKNIKPVTHVTRVTKVVNPSSSSSSSDAIDISKHFKNVYYVWCELIYNGEVLKDIGWSGTGFLLNNGCFVTAQHMIHVDQIDFVKVKDPNDPNKTKVIPDPGSVNNLINALYYAGKIKVRMSCFSTADEFQLDYSYSSMPFALGQSKLVEIPYVDEKGASWVLKTHPNYGGGDWAYVKRGKSGELPFDGAFSTNLPVQTKLSVVGFPAGQGATVGGKVSPIVSQAVTSRQGLENNGTIKTSNDNSDHGNSGGPVFAVKDKKYVVIGILSGANPGQESMKGRVIPIGAAFK